MRRDRGARRRLALSGLLAGASAAWMLLDASLSPAPLSAFVFGLALAWALPRARRVRAGGGHLSGWTMAGAALALAAHGPRDAGAYAFAAGLAVTGLWLSRGAAVPLDAPPDEDRRLTGASWRALRRTAP